MAVAVLERAVATLADLRPGQAGHVLGVPGGDPAVARRLVELGFAAGAHVAMVRRAPLGDPVIFRVAGVDVALRRAQARCIMLEIEPMP